MFNVYNRFVLINPLNAKGVYTRYYQSYIHALAVGHANAASYNTHSLRLVRNAVKELII